ncbi:hypothetical protein F5884DRAFT_762599 [Xylogone sp. PMI_703]|nr:hypothetical protein F5884DRAFT_762599 [Xylogone sp. PMI_703]
MHGVDAAELEDCTTLSWVRITIRCWQAGISMYHTGTSQVGTFVYEGRRMGFNHAISSLALSLRTAQALTSNEADPRPRKQEAPLLHLEVHPSKLLTAKRGVSVYACLRERSVRLETKHTSKCESVSKKKWRIGEEVMMMMLSVSMNGWMDEGRKKCTVRSDNTVIDSVLVKRVIVGRMAVQRRLAPLVPAKHFCAWGTEEGCWLSIPTTQGSMRARKGPESQRTVAYSKSNSSTVCTVA